MTSCSRNHEPDVPRALGALDDSQHGFWHRRCAACAYEMGRADGARAEDRLMRRVADLEAQLRRLEVSRRGA
ncbi:MAG: hypothetical protein KF773_26260 [Deltaproteobacteria bacterium]|nr:hypothetical protein [Deltaproteobacteria bacterium]MCW5805408.1 hypothetical protein [Deltaproteobacteria bacterium]